MSCLCSMAEQLPFLEHLKGNILNWCHHWFVLFLFIFLNLLVSFMSLSISQISWWYYFSLTACESLKSGPNQETSFNGQMLCVWSSLCPTFSIDSSAELEFRSVSRKWTSRIPRSQAKNSFSVENNKDVFCISRTLDVRWRCCIGGIPTARG